MTFRRFEQAVWSVFCWWGLAVAICTLAAAAIAIGLAVGRLVLELFGALHCR